MSEKRSKYDTDPLDPDFVRRTGETGGATGQAPGGAGEQARRVEAGYEEPTRRFDDQTRRFDAPPAPAPTPYQPANDPLNGSYPSVFVPPVYQPPQQQQGYTGFGAGAGTPPSGPHVPFPPSSPYTAKPTSRPVAKMGLPENIVNVLPYAPFHIGLVAAIIELLLVPRHETRTRFHAAQGLALQLVFVVGLFLFNLVGSVTGIGFGKTLFYLASLVFFFVSMFRVWEGKPHHIAPLDEATRWLNEKFEPRK